MVVPSGLKITRRVCALCYYCASPMPRHPHRSFRKPQTVPPHSHLPLSGQLKAAPFVHDAARADRELAALVAAAAGNDASHLNLAPLKDLLTQEPVARLLRGVFSASPYLTRLIARHPGDVQRCLATAPQDAISNFTADLHQSISRDVSRPALMHALRRYKSQMALLIAFTDLGGVWSTSDVTHALSVTADTAVTAAVAHVFTAAHQRGDWLDPGSNPETRSGYFVAAMGKHGAYELNYSSDIDLIVFYDPTKARLRGTLELQTFFVRLTRDLVKILSEPTEDGYVFRTDLRLRPDPGSTPIALSTGGAMHYYESVGQNWERAALIKARVIAGDFDTGETFLTSLAPFIWRKYLDFAAIADIHAMKRQIHAVKGFGTIAVAGHNIKVGRGGIREIEFFTQTQQLIAGGRQPDLRIPTPLGRSSTSHRST